jgi:hypothetical protein
MLTALIFDYRNKKRVANEEEDSFEKKNLDPGESVQLLNSKIGSSYLNLEVSILHRKF